MARDLAVYERMGASGAIVVAAVTAQNATRVTGVFALPPRAIVAQLEALWSEREPDAIRIGLLPAAAGIRAVARFLEKRRRLPPVVLDPVLSASSGHRFSGPREIAALAALFPLCTVVTPNAGEAHKLTGLRVRDADDAESAARILAAAGPAVLVKGGHLAGSHVTDVLVHRGSTTRFRSRRLCMRMRGTGCTLAAALAVRLARGERLIPAIRSARLFVRAEMLAHAR